MMTGGGKSTFAIRTGLILGLVVAITGCTAPQRDIPGHVTYLPDGQAGYAVTCDKPFSDEAECLTRAGQICREYGYKLVNKSDDLLSFKRDIMIRCATQSGLYPGDRNQ